MHQTPRVIYTVLDGPDMLAGAGLEPATSPSPEEVLYRSKLLHALSTRSDWPVRLSRSSWYAYSFGQKSGFTT